ncbi:MAG: helix-turn-helix domain-containing protein [Bacillota bacterium]
MTKNTACFWLICLCFLWTSASYLSWMYRLMRFGTDIPVEFATEVLGYLFQAAGILVFSLCVRRFPPIAGKRTVIAVIAADFLLMVPALLARPLAAVLVCGCAMNLLHGVIAGFYLYRLALTVEWQRRSLVFGLGYAVSAIGAWLISLPGDSNFLCSPYAPILYGLFAAATVWLLLNEGVPAAERIRFDGEKPAVSVIVLAGVTVFLLSLVKNLGFGFPAADVSAGIDLELSRVFYAVSLVIAGVISDRERKYGAICCVAVLGIPFLMIVLTDQVSASILFWCLNYLIFGFFTVFRAILFCDIARKDRSLLYLAGFGLMCGRFGDAAGTFGWIALSDHVNTLIIIAAVLFALTILLFFPLYQRIYLPAPIKGQSEQERFERFSETYSLSLREREVLRLILAGQSNAEIAGNLYIAESTVKFHIRNLLKKTERENRVSLVALYKKS